MVKKSSKKVEINITPKVSVNKKSSRKRRGRKGMGSVAHISTDPTAYAKLLIDPFDMAPVHIPDDNTRLSGLVTTRVRLIYTPLAATNSTTHNGIVTFAPSLYSGYRVANEDASGGGIWTGVNGSAVPTAYPNAAAAIGATVGQDWGVSKSRVIAAGIKVSYLGTELQRAGKIHFLQHNCESFSDPTIFDPFYAGPLGATGTGSIASILQRSTISSSGRVKDTSVVGHLVPTSTGIYLGVTGTTSLSVTPFPFARITDASQLSTFSVLIVNDSTSAASTSGNSYEIEFIMHSEVIPANPFNVTYPVEPSFYDPESLAYGRNMASSTSNSNYLPNNVVGIPSSVNTGYANTISSIGGSLLNAASGMSTGFANALGYADPYRLAGAAGAAYIRAQMQRRPMIQN